MASVSPRSLPDGSDGRGRALCARGCDLLVSHTPLLQPLRLPGDSFVALIDNVVRGACTLTSRTARSSTRLGARPNAHRVLACEVKTKRGG